VYLGAIEAGPARPLIVAAVIAAYIHFGMRPEAPGISRPMQAVFALVLSTGLVFSAYGIGWAVFAP